MATRTTKKGIEEETPLVYGDGVEEPEQNPGDTSTNEPGQDDPQTPDTSTGDTSTGDSSTGDSSTGDSSTGDSSTGDSSTGENEQQEETEMTLQESIQAQLKRGSEIVDMGPNYKTTYNGTTKGASMEAGAAQASNMQTATTVGARIPQVDTTEYAVRARFAANGQNAGKNSEFAIKATSEGAGFKPTKDVKANAFPEDGAGYQEVVNTQNY